MYVCMYICIYVYMYMYICVYIFIFMFVCLCVYMCIYIRTYIINIYSNNCPGLRLPRIPRIPHHNTIPMGLCGTEILHAALACQLAVLVDQHLVGKLLDSFSGQPLGFLYARFWPAILFIYYASWARFDANFPASPSLRMAPAGRSAVLSWQRVWFALGWCALDHHPRGARSKRDRPKRPASFTARSAHISRRSFHGIVVLSSQLASDKETSAVALRF